MPLADVNANGKQIKVGSIADVNKDDSDNAAKYICAADVTDAAASPEVPAASPDEVAKVPEVPAASPDAVGELLKTGGRRRKSRKQKKVAKRKTSKKSKKSSKKGKK